MKDLISRKAAIDALDKIFPADPMRNDYTQGITCGAALAKEYIKQLPSAQPETHGKRTETHACDCIERQAAIDVLNVGAELLRRVLDDADIVGAERAKYEWGLGLIESYISDMKEIQSAQPDSKELSSTHKALDTISRQAALNALSRGSGCGASCHRAIKDLPSAQPEIIYCKDCVKHNKGHGYYLDGTFIGIKDCCPLVEIRGMAQGHEFDYQYCVYAERRTND